jgi:hypothetical protein
VAKRGPKPTVTPRRKKRLLYMLRVGMSLADARTALGLSEPAVRRARHDDAKFDAGVKSAAARGKARHLRRIDQGVKCWQASAWFLERKYGAEYGQKVRLDVGGAVRVVEEVVGAPAPHANGQAAAAPGAGRLPPQ